jgi:hypothetical protein
MAASACSRAISFSIALWSRLASRVAAAATSSPCSAIWTRRSAACADCWSRSR